MQRPCGGLILRLRCAIDCPTVKKLKGSEAFHGYPMFQLEAIGEEEERRRRKEE
jgi:hypothetical protein